MQPVNLQSGKVSGKKRELLYLRNSWLAVSDARGRERENRTETELSEGTEGRGRDEPWRDGCARGL